MKANDSFIYFLKPKGYIGPFKIGSSTIPLERLMAYSVWSPFPLELIGTVPGTLRDEYWLHSCFADCHSHSEWFRATPKLREAIAAILNAGNLDQARLTLKRIGTTRAKRRPSTPGQNLRRSLFTRINWAKRRARAELGEDGAWREPDRVSTIVNKWWSADREYVPTSDEIATIEHYLADPITRGEIPSWLPSAQPAPLAL